jgi:hypothetical protein
VGGGVAAGVLLREGGDERFLLCFLLSSLV